MSYPVHLQTERPNSWDVKLEGLPIKSSNTSGDSAVHSVLHNLPDAGMSSDQKAHIVKSETPLELSDEIISMSNGVGTVFDENKSLVTSNGLSTNGFLQSESATHAAQIPSSNSYTWHAFVCKDSKHENSSFIQKVVPIGTSSANDIELNECDSTSASRHLKLSNDDSVRGNSVGVSLSLLSSSGDTVVVNSIQQHPPVDSVLNIAPLSKYSDQESASNLLNKSWKFHDCSKVRPSHNSYEYHLKLHTSGKRFKCDKCDKSFCVKRSLNNHLLSHSVDGSNSLRCQLCDKVLSSLNCLKQHNTIHTGERPFKCNRCDKAYLFDSQLQTHMISHSDDRKRFKCKLCKSAYSHEHSLRKHVKQLHSDKQRPMFKCKQCSKAYVEKGTLLQHMKVHEGVRDVYRCEDCKKIFHKRKLLLQHMRSDKHNTEKLYKCQECDKWFAARYMLNNHVRHVHPEQPRQRRYKCDDCSKMFHYMSALKEHMNVHLNVKPFTCDVCGKSFTRQLNLKQHVVIHSGLKPFKCNLCDKAFSWHSHLTSHLRGHQGLKLHQCEQCGKSFSERSGLRLHMRSYHQTELPYTNSHLRKN